MSAELINKFCLGTVQLGRPYGIANTKGAISGEEAFGILGCACRAGISTFDTAYSYEKSEERIGEFMRRSKRSLDVISKPPALMTNDREEIEKLFRASLDRLTVNSVYGYLIHNFNDFLENDWMWSALEALKEKKLVKKIGFSLYEPRELETLLERKVCFDIAQVPYSVFDRRFENYFEVLKANNVEIFVRSVFLQGLVFLSPDGLPDNLTKAGGRIRDLRQLSAAHDISISSLCANFALLNPRINKVIIGVNSLMHLRDNLMNVKDADLVRSVCAELGRLVIEDEDILMPHRWAKS